MHRRIKEFLNDPLSQLGWKYASRHGLDSDEERLWEMALKTSGLGKPLGLLDASPQEILGEAAFHARQCNVGTLCKARQFDMYGPPAASVTSYLAPDSRRV